MKVCIGYRVFYRDGEKYISPDKEGKADLNQEQLDFLQKKGVPYTVLEHKGLDNTDPDKLAEVKPDDEQLREELSKLKVKELKERLLDLGISDFPSNAKKENLIDIIIKELS